jgi:5-methylcytosine-specific restriction protein A
MFLRNHPLCEACMEQGRTTPATDVHHIIARRSGGPDEEGNLQALCHACHSAKTARGE